MSIERHEGTPISQSRRVTRRVRILPQPAKAVLTEGEPLVLEGALLIDGTGGPPVGDAVVLVEAGRIRFAGPPNPHLDGSPARRVSLTGKTLIPGLIEAHTHAASKADMLGYVKNGV